MPTKKGLTQKSVSKKTHIEMKHGEKHSETPTGMADDMKKKRRKKKDKK